ncbi:MAG: flagellin lysine-N-methylase [Oscillospiraceae bacterium]|nr:flagellin lysine-N-methylase [Oscillospiraceae bacterium]
MKQVNFYPKYYRKFQCIASDCEDSCCAQWQIVVDDDSAIKYDSVSGEMGEKLRRVQETDEDGDRVFRLENERCPFWEKSGLCEIHRKLGEEYLCHTCREYPRAVQDYADFAEHDLSLSCPEAARIILSDESLDTKKEETVCHIPDEEICYDPDFMDFLKKARRHIYSIIKNPELSTASILTKCYIYACQLQKLIDRDEFVCPEPEIKHWDAVQDICYTDLIDSLLRMEILTAEWREMLLDAKALGNVSIYSPECADMRTAMSAFSNGYRKLFLHYIDKYWLRTAFDYDAAEKILLIITAYTIIRRLQMAYYQNNKDLPFSASLRIVQLCSKETEHNTSDEMYALFRHFTIECDN